MVRCRRVNKVADNRFWYFRCLRQNHNVFIPDIVRCIAGVGYSSRCGPRSWFYRDDGASQIHETGEEVTINHLTKKNQVKLRCMIRWTKNPGHCSLDSTFNALPARIPGQTERWPTVSLGIVYHSVLFSNSGFPQTYLYISGGKRVEGYCVAEAITSAYPVLRDDERSQASPGRRNKAWCCSTEPVVAKCGISRIWVYADARRQGIASKLLDCVR